MTEVLVNHCQFIVKHKKRYCRMTVKKGLKFCGEHRFCDKESYLDERIACPLDPSHTCCKSKLAKHLKKCNAQQIINKKPSYIVEGINLGDFSALDTTTPLKEIDDSILTPVFQKINKSYETLPKFLHEILSHDVVEQEINNLTFATKAKKHLIQTSSLLGHIGKAGFVKNNSCFIEFGAGRGKLTYWLAQTIKSQTNCSLLLVDKSSHRHKKDNKLKNEDCEFNIKRVHANIADLKLSEIPDINKFDHKVGIAKHLCGAATDLTIRCLANFMKCSENTESLGLLIAFCCHHQCNYQHYVGHDFLESQNFTKDEFPILCKIASWATCGFNLNSLDNKNFAQREIIGFKVKVLLNYGRLKFLENLGFECDLVYYTNTEITLENMCIIAKKFIRKEQ